jgi:transposase
VARSEHPYRYSQFCELYASWRGKQRLSMRQVHRAGEKLFVDYSGKRPHIVDPTTGESRDVELFVAVMGASNYSPLSCQRSTRFAHSADVVFAICTLLVSCKSGSARCERHQRGTPDAYLVDER